MATHFSMSGEFHGQRSLVGYSPWGHKESDTSERLTPPPPCNDQSFSRHELTGAYLELCLFISKVFQRETSIIFLLCLQLLHILLA